MTVAAVIALGGCGSGDDAAANDTIGVAQDSPSASAQAAQPRAPKTPPLPRKFDDMTSEEFVKHVDTLKFNDAVGHVRGRRCVGGAGRCDIRISPEAGADSVSPVDLKASYVVARLINEGKAAESVYKIPPGDTAYWLVEPGLISNTPNTSRMIVVKGSTNRRAIVLPGVFEYRDCHNVYTEGLRADMRGCLEHGLAPGRDDVPDLEARSWISCLAGCCTG